MSVFKRALAILFWALLVTSRSSAGADIFAEATAGRDRVITPAYFGTHFHRLVLNADEKAIRTRWPSLTFGSVRFWDSDIGWAHLAPQPGQWNFDRMDVYVGETNTHNASALYTLGVTPRWASARPNERCPYGLGCAAEPVRLAHWEEYVRRVATRYKGLIGAFELWNEPYFSDLARDRAQPMAFFSGRLADMVELARIARRVLDETSPGTILSTPGFVNGPDRLDMFLGAGGKNYVQAIAYHFYSNDSERFVRQILDVREIMRRHGVERMPLWNTELGVEVEPEDSPLPPGVTRRLTHTEAAAHMAQYLVLGAAAGLERFYYYAWDNWRSGMVTSRGDRLPAYDAMAKVQSWLIGSRMKGCVSPNRGVVSCRGEASRQAFLIAWASQHGEQSLRLPPGMKVGQVEGLFSTTPVPNYQARVGVVQIQLGSAPVRIMLVRQALP